MSIRQRSIAGASLLVCLWAAMASAYAQLDLTVRDMEVTQVLQKLDNSVRLAAEKATLVRIYVGVSGTTQPVSGVDALLYIYQNGIEIEGSPFVPIRGPITAPLQPNRANENHTINFYPPPLSGDRIDIVAQVNPARTIPELNYDNNFGSVEGLNFECHIVPSFVYVPTDYRPRAPGPEPNPPDADLVAPYVGDMFVRAIYPVKDIDYRAMPGPTLVWDQDINRSSGAYLSRLSTIRQMMKPMPDFIYGWLPGNPFSGNGQAQCVSSMTRECRAAFGNTDVQRFQRTFAHEIGHLFGQVHNNRRINEVGFDVDNVLDLGGPKLGTMLDIMVAGRLTHEAWVDLITYNSFLNRPVLACPRAGMAGSQPYGEYLFVTGVIDKEGRSTLNPVYKLEGPINLTAADESGRYALIVEDAQGNQLYRLPFSVDFETDSESEASSAGFSLAIPTLGSMARVVLTQDGIVLDQIERSPNAPQAVFLPAANTLVGTNLIAWNAVDPDGDRLNYSLQYSPDGGNSFVPLAVNVTDSEILLNAEQLEKSENGILRLLITDGLNTTVVDKTGLNVISQ